MEKSLDTPLSDEAWSGLLSDAYGEVEKAVQLAAEEFTKRWGEFCEWVSQPHIRAGIIAVAGILTFAAIFFGVPALGFGASGIVAGSWAAGFQGAVYGGITPAAGLFAGLTSAGMSGQVPALAAIGAATTMASGWAIGQHKELENWFQENMAQK
ncbi:hypothetical protein BDV93DRAFT_607642 [Ceratobasidium sp. AG-I]|nr:hypothetical protein BDV93DRAFT_607642 [Ceratobasidium sp. AG-I]